MSDQNDENKDLWTLLVWEEDGFSYFDTGAMIFRFPGSLREVLESLKEHAQEEGDNDTLKWVAERLEQLLDSKDEERATARERNKDLS